MTLPRPGNARRELLLRLEAVGADEVLPEVAVGAAADSKGAASNQVDTVHSM